MDRAALLLLAMAVVTTAQADTVWLKNGGTIDGTVVAETQDQVVVDIGGGRMTLQRSEIDRIERSGKVEEPPRREEKAPAAQKEPPAAAPPPTPPDDDPSPKPEEVRIKEASVYASQGRLNLSFRVVQPEGAAILLLRDECRIESWTDEQGVAYEAAKAEFMGFSMYDGAEGLVQILIDGSPDARVESFQVAGTIAYRLGWERREGKTDPVELSEATTFEIEGIPFTIWTPERPFATEEELRTRSWIELRCPYAEYQPGDFVFLTSLTFWGEDGREIPSRNNQASEFSDPQGNAGFFFTFDIEGKPSTASIRYKLWGRMKTMAVPFEVSAPIRR